LSALKGYNYEVLKEEFDNLIQVTKNTSDPYLLSLAAGALINVDKIDEAKSIASRVASMQDKTTGMVEGAVSSITNSRGNNLIVETTSLALINWLNIDPSTYGNQIDLAIAFILKQTKDGGRFGSTQATILSLQALVRYS
jgi:alpha-2-macroglobulin-like protein